MSHNVCYVLTCSTPFRFCVNGMFYEYIYAAVVNQ